MPRMRRRTLALGTVRLDGTADMLDSDWMVVVAPSVQALHTTGSVRRRHLLASEPLVPTIPAELPARETTSQRVRERRNNTFAPR